MNKRIAFGGILVLVLLLAVPVTAAFADCVPGQVGGTGDDTITCTGPTFGLISGEDIIGGTDSGGNDIISNSGSSGPILGEFISDGSGNGGNDLIVNSGNVDGGIYGDIIIGSTANGHGGNDTIINSGDATGDIVGDFITNGTGNGGNDTIINSGNVTGGIYGDIIISSTANGHGGNDTIIHSGTATGIYGDLIIGGTGTGNGGDDVIIVSGIVDTDVVGDGISHPTGNGGNDSVVILDRARIDGIIYGDQISGAGTGGTNDALHLNFAQREATPEEYFWFVEAMDAASAAGGYVCWMGNCYTWTEFEHLSWRLDYNFGPAAIYFLDIPLEELPVYGDGAAPFCTFYSGQHGPKWIASEQCGDFTDAGALDVVCLTDTGTWSSGNVSGVGADADGKLSFSTSQHGICGVYPAA